MAGILDNPVGAAPVLQMDAAQGILGGANQMRPGAAPQNDIMSGLITPAMQSIAQDQGGVGFTYISKLADKLGLPTESLTAILPDLYKAGLINLHKSSTAEGRMTPEQQAGVVTLGNQRLHLISLPK